MASLSTHGASHLLYVNEVTRTIGLHIGHSFSAHVPGLLSHQPSLSQTLTTKSKIKLSKISKQEKQNIKANVEPSESEALCSCVGPHVHEDSFSPVHAYSF